MLMFDGTTRIRLARYVPHRWRFAARRWWQAVDRISKGAPFRRLTPNSNPVLIVGNQKSGTSAVAGLLAKATGSSVVIDLVGELISPTVPGVLSGQTGVEEFLDNNNVDFTRQVIKDCHMTLIIDQILEHIPGAKVLYVVRDPRDNIRSILNRLDIDGRAHGVPAELWNRLGPGWRLVLDGEWLGIETRDLVTSLAERWNRLADVYLTRPSRMTLVKFEDFAVDRRGYIERLAERIDKPAVVDITRDIDTPFQPPGDRHVSLEAFFGAENLTRIETVCSDRMKEFGYQVSADDGRFV